MKSIKASKGVITTFILCCALAAVPAFSQGRGVNVGVGVGSQTNVGVGRGAGATASQGAGVNVGVKTNSAQAGVSAETKTGVAIQPEAKTARSGANLVSRIESNPPLVARVQSLLPSGESLTSASTGFENEGQFISALHASHNLDIPFDQLKAKMTGSNAMSLGSAIKASKPEMSETQAKEEAKKAASEAKTTAAVKANASANANAAANAARKPSDKQ